MSLQPAPEPERASSYSSAALTTSGDGGGTTPGSPAGPFETELSNDNRLKGALHKLVLVLPLTILIHEQALLHPDEKIKLPLVDLELKVHDITPIFLMLVCYMLYRALRYARIVLWTFSNSQEKMNTVGQIILDNTEAYKLNAACYEEVLDPMAAASVALWARWKPIWFRDLSWAVWGGFNVLKSLILYGFILLLLVLLALYTSKEALSVVASRQLSPWQIRWFAEPTVGIDAVILCISSLMLLLAWSNAAAIVLLAVWTVLIRIMGLVVVSFRIPMRWLIRRLYRWAIEFRAEQPRRSSATIRCWTCYRSDLAKRSVADLKIELSEIPAFPLDRHLGLVLLFELRGRPFFPDCPKGVLELFVFLSLGLAHCDRILAVIEQLFCVVALCARGLESDAGKGAKRHIFLRLPPKRYR
jgi:hypothetical protein